MALEWATFSDGIAERIGAPVEIDLGLAGREGGCEQLGDAAERVGADEEVHVLRPRQDVLPVELSHASADAHAQLRPILLGPAEGVPV